MTKFKLIATPIGGLYEIEPAVFGDDRGFFMETYNQKAFAEVGLDITFVQDNHSKSGAGVLRGLHFQTAHPQGKLVRVIRGSVFDVAVDLRPESPTFGQWHGVLLTAENKRQLYISEGFAHGFLTLEDETEFLYKCTDFYDPDAEAGIRYDDPTLAITWPLEEVLSSGRSVRLSEKDANLPTWAEYFGKT